MTSIFEHYRVLGVSVGAGMADVTSSYKRLCRIYHPDINGDPESEEQMKRINAAYTVLRDKFRREAASRERSAHYRNARRHAGAETRTGASDARRTNTATEREAFFAIHGYFKALCSYDFSDAYDFLSSYDKRHVTRESFIQWRKSVSRLFPMRDFTVDSKSAFATVSMNDDMIIYARKFKVMVTEENQDDHTASTGEVEKLVINENGVCKVLLGYKNVGELTRTFDERFEAGRKRDIAKRFDEFYGGLHQEFGMYSLAGMRREVSRELYRYRRFGGKLTFAAIFVRADRLASAGHEQLLRSAAVTINKKLRETDIPAYAGDGVFAILFVELHKKNAEEIIARLADDIRANAGAQLGARADIEYAFASWSDGSFADMDALNKVLWKFRKKL